jgi:putative heme iron utilization protein
MNRIIAWGAAIVSLFLFIGCGPHVVILKDGTIIETKYPPAYDRRTGFYDYQSLDGVNGHINRDEIVEIREKK